MKIKEIQNLLNENSCALISSDVNRFYLCEFPSSAGNIIITKDSATLLIDFRYFEKAKKTVKNMDVLLLTSLYKDIKSVLTDKKVKNIYIETEHITLETLNRMEKGLEEFCILKDSVLSQKLNELRQITRIFLLFC